MKWLILLFFLDCQPTSTDAQQRPLSDEDFVNAVYKLVIDSNAAYYYVAAEAAPCSFKKYDYDEWYKYGLKEDVPIYILNELAKKSFEDAASRLWQQEKLLNAFCIDEEKAKIRLTATAKRHVSSRRPQPADDKMVYYFSRPVFTDDYQYAIIDMGFRCDNQQCGMGATFLFKQVNGKWTIAGRKMVWGN